MTLFKGAGTALVTPFSEGRVDYDRLKGLLDWQVSSGIDAIVSCGTTGEASTLNDEEHIRTVTFTVDAVKKKVPVIAGAGSNDTAHAVFMAQALENAGADGLLMVTPYYNCLLYTSGIRFSPGKTLRYIQDPPAFRRSRRPDPRFR